MWLSDDLTIQVVGKGGGRSELRRSIGSKLHATQNDLALPVDDCYWPRLCKNESLGDAANRLIGWSTIFWCLGPPTRELIMAIKR